MTSATMTITAEELERMALGEQRVELVRGEVITMAPAGAEHGEIAGFTFGVLFQFVRAHSLGSLYAAETGFVLARNPDTVRAPDVAFVRMERAAQQRGRTGFFEGCARPGGSRWCRRTIPQKRWRRRCSTIWKPGRGWSGLCVRERAR
jgi:Uma2 family endonuclease